MHCVVLGPVDGVESSLVTTDGGKTWSESPVSGLPSGFTPIGLQCYPGGTCAALGSSNSGSQTTALYSTDSGATWELGSVPSGFELGYNFSCGSPVNCEAAGAGPGDAAAIVASTDGGRSWHPVSTPRGSPSAQSVNWIACAGARTCWLAEYYGRSFEGRVAATVNGGASWHLFSQPPDVHGIGSLSCPSAGLCYGLAGPEEASQRNDTLFVTWR